MFFFWRKRIHVDLSGGCFGGMACRKRPKSRQKTTGYQALSITTSSITGRVNGQLLPRLKRSFLSSEEQGLDFTPSPLQDPPRSFFAAQGFQGQQGVRQHHQGHMPRGQGILRDKVESTTGPAARLYKKATADKKVVPSYRGHASIEDSNGLAVAAAASLAATIAERK